MSTVLGTAPPSPGRDSTFGALPARWHPVMQPCATVESRIIEQCAMSLELPSLVRSGVFLFFYDSQRG